MKICVIGGGNIGTLLIGDIGGKDEFSVRLLTSRPDEWNNIIEVCDEDGSLKHVGNVDIISNKPEDVIKDADIILNDLEQVVSNPKGTGHEAYIPGMTLAGKTGTAEIKASQEDTSGTEVGWFAAVNVDNPKLLVIAMVENAKEKGGSHYVVPIVRSVFEQVK